MNNIALHNTLTNTKEVFSPENPKRITMYVCGPTVYDHAHIGNARPAVVFDTLFRLLRMRYGKNSIVYARNITDIDDKINDASLQTGLPISEIAQRYRKSYASDMHTLGVLHPTYEPHATGNVSEIIAMIKKLISKKHAYVSEKHVLFSVSSFKDYGKLSNRDYNDLLAGARVDIASYKKDPSDFILWKPSSKKLPGWDSPWGRGRPGWHIECSAMIKKHLGESIDIHAGGNDLIFPHHENEIAQSNCCHEGKPLARMWIHNGYLTNNREKMSKSLGNIITINEIKKNFSGEGIRLALLSAQYRQPLEWSSKLLTQAEKTLDRFYGSLEKLSNIEPANINEYNSEFIEALTDDLNTPKAISVLSKMCKKVNANSNDKDLSVLKHDILKSGYLLGLLQKEPSEWFKAKIIDNSNVDDLIEKRNIARKNKNFDEADKIRSKLLELGVKVEDRSMRSK